jgi:hypothetical protein
VGFKSQRLLSIPSSIQPFLLPAAFFAAAFFFSRFLRFFLASESESLSDSELELLEESDSEDESDEELSVNPALLRLLHLNFPSI